MKCLLLLTLVAFCCALPYYGGSKSINISEDGTIVITGANGKRVVISKAVGNTDDKYIDISVEGPNLPTKRIRVNEQGADKTVSVQNGAYSGQFNGQTWEDELRDKRSPKLTTTKDGKKSKSQSDLLYTIFKQYEGVVDEKSYETLLKKVNEYVISGELDASVYDVLKYLHDQKVAQEQGLTETGVQTSGIGKVRLIPSDISSLVRDYIWTNKYQQPGVSGNVVPERNMINGQWVPQQNVYGQWEESPEQWRQQLWQWSQPQQVASQPLNQESVSQQWTPTQQWASQPQWVQQPWISEQQKWVSPQQQWVPQQQQLVPQQQQWVPQQQQLVPQQQQWVPQQPQWIPQQWVPQNQQLVSQQQWVSPRQWVPQQQWTSQQQLNPEQQQWVSQQKSINPWVAYYLGQSWNQQTQGGPQQNPVGVGRVEGYPSLRQGLVY